MSDFGHTDTHVYRTGAIQSERLKHAPLKGLTYQGRFEDGNVRYKSDEPIPSEFAAHAASEYTDDDEPRDGIQRGIVVWGLSMVAVACFAAWARNGFSLRWLSWHA